MRGSGRRAGTAVLVVPALLLAAPALAWVAGASTSTGSRPVTAPAPSRVVPARTAPPLPRRAAALASTATSTATATATGTDTAASAAATSGTEATSSTECLTTPAPGLAPGRVEPASGTRAGLVRFHVYDTAGRRLDWPAFRELQENGKGEDGDNDMLVDPTSLQVRTEWPLYEDDGDPVLDRPAGPVTLSMAWPTGHGYSTLLLDLPDPGTYVLPLLAARQALADVHGELVNRPSYHPSEAFSGALTLADSELARAEAADVEAERGRHGALAYEAAVDAQLLLLREYGVQYAAGGAAGAGSTPTPAVTGFTMDAVGTDDTPLRTAQTLGGGPGRAAVRLVFDLGEGPEHYRDTIAAAHAVGVRVVGQILDSSQMAAVSLAEWQQRVARFVEGLPDVDAWEVGNEVNGDWLGPDVPAKIAYAADYVKQHTSASTLLTLYWQLGEDDATHSVFTWAAAVPPETFRDVDEIGLSVYPEDHPMGVAFDRVVSALHRTFPQQRLSVSELGYWSSDLGHTWWWGSQADPSGEGRRDVADLYARAVLGYPFSAGGTYWWYFLEEVVPGNALFATFAAVRDDVARAGAEASCP
jgi:hypothetical protein